MRPEERLEILSIDEDLLPYATPAELKLYQKALEIEQRLDGLMAYMQSVNESVEARPHTVLIAEYVDALIEGRLYRDGPGPKPVLGLSESGQGPVWVHPETGEPVVYNLVLHAPPRHGKSFVVSEHLPAYLLTKYPDLKGILAAYEQTFAESWGEKIRDHIIESQELFGVEVKGGLRASKGDFGIKGHSGRFKAAGAGGSITGRGGQWLIIDDPISNSEDAMSEVIRAKQEAWWWSTFYNRRERWPDGTPGRVLGMWTRWHEDDLRGRVIDPHAEDWCILNLPAIWEPTDDEPVDPLGRQPGEPLSPEVMGIDELTSLRKATPLWFESMYQGRPYIAEGNLIRKPFWHYKLETDDNGAETYTLYLPDGSTRRIPQSQCMRFAAVDLAASTKTTADYTVLGVFDVSKTTPRYMMVRAIERTRIETDAHGPFIVEQHKRYKFRYALVEKQTYGTTLIKVMQRYQQVPVRGVDADRDKTLRAVGVIPPALDARVLFFPQPGDAEWYPAFEKEILRFPNGTHDDQVDVLAYACQEFLSLPALLKTKDDYAPGPEGRAQRTIDRLRGGKKGRPLHPDLGRL